MRIIDAYRAIDMIDEWLDSVGTVLVGKGLSSYGELIGCIEDTPTLTPQSEWVSVEEGLPEVGQEVLVYWRNTSQKAEHFELTHYDGDHWFLLDNTERPWIVVVAWMPLPAPPDRRPPEGSPNA